LPVIARIGKIAFSRRERGPAAMTTVSTSDPQFQSAIQACAVALHRMVDYELAPSLQRRLHELGERKEFLTTAEYEELLALVDFVHKRTIEKLEAQTALARLRTATPGVLPDL
jgi:predicted house-cleaning noncanonical NTP pyrophosphatase (MazG superfamily)